MSTLRVILDDLLNPAAGRRSRYAADLTRALIRTAPRGTTVGAVVSASREEDYERIEQLLPGLDAIHKSALARRELVAAWQHGFTPVPGEGFLHATSLLAPLSRHDRLETPSSQIAVTIHDAIPWTHPELLGRSASWFAAMARRAEKYADAVVVPTHAVADELAEHYRFGDRVRVIGGAPAVLRGDADDATIDVPERTVLGIVAGDPLNGFADLVAATRDLDAPLVLVVDGASEAAVREIVGDAEVRLVVDPSDPDLARLLTSAAVYVQPSLAAGFGAEMIDAFAAGAAVIHTDAPALVEVAAGAGLEVPRGEVDALRDAIRSVLDDEALAERLRVQSEDRAKAFTWVDAAEKIWQLHADL